MFALLKRIFGKRRQSVRQQELSQTRLAESSKLQPRGARQRTDIIIGLDFGTSCSKVVLRAPYIRGGLAWAVPIGDTAAKDARKYLRATPFDPAIGSLKAALMREPAREDIKTRAGFYLSEVITDSKAWLLETEKDLFKQFNVTWRLAIGCPSESGDEPVSHGFLEMARLAAQADGDTIATIDVYPEMAASAAGYARSDRREPGLHLLMDVGATTLDVCGFILTKNEGEDRYNILVARVECLGAHQLHYTRLRNLGGREVPKPVKTLILDPSSEIPSTCDAYAQEVSNELAEGDRAFRKQCTDQLMFCLHALKTRRDPRAPVWQEGLPILYTGGASQMDFYRQVISDAEERMWPMGMKAGFKVKPLPLPFRLEKDAGISQSTFLRLGTAYGLSFGELVGAIKPSADFADIPRATRRVPPPFVSKDCI
jgi:hypothetical protein